MTRSEFERRFPSDDACLEFLKERSYPAGTWCPWCAKRSRFHRIARPSAYSCQYCGHHVYPTAGTIFHRSRTSLMLWFRAMESVRTSGDHLTARGLERELGVSYKTALRMYRQIGLLLDEEPDPLASGEVVRTPERTQPRQGKGGRRAMNKRFGMRSLRSRRFVLSAVSVVAVVVGAAAVVSQVRVTAHRRPSRAPIS